MIPTSQESITFNLSINPHVFIEPFTPPVPLLICLIAAGLAVIASFVVVGFFARNPKVHRSYPQINIGNWKLVKILSSRFTIITIQISSVLLFTLLLLTGFIGNPDPLYNLAPTLVWVIWWVGVAYLSAFIGDVWLLLNPWSIVFSWVEYIWRLFHSGKSLSPLMKYPIKAGVWPALSFFVIFAWIENVYPDAVIPLRISQMIILYSVFTWIGMILFGKKIWLNHGETFSLAFGFLAKFAPIATTSLNNKFNETETNRPMDILRNHDDSELETQRSKAIILRPFAAGLLNTGKGSTSKMLFILFLLATVTFDGFTATKPWINIQIFFERYIPNIMSIGTLGLVFSVLIFVLVYLVFCKLMSLTKGINFSVLELGGIFVYTLIPIALAYHVAHFILFLIIQGQLIIPLASDPFGFNWDLFGTANYRVNFKLISPNLYWFTSVIAIVTGHIVAVFLAHSIALRLGGSRHYALRSQYPMLLLMVGYTIASLWIITQPMYMPAM